ncbi:MAG: hypothetical protein ABIB79_02460 [archaeon]
MGKRYLPGEQRKILLDFIKKNPKTTYKEIKKKTKLHPERIFKGCLKEAFDKAGVKHPRTFEFKTKEQKRKIIINYIKNHPHAGGQTIKKDTKINFQTIFKTTKEAFLAAGVDYLREIDKRTREEKRKQIIKTIKENPLLNTIELQKKTKTQPYHFFKNINEIYKEAGIKPLKRTEKRGLKKKQEIIKFIKENPLATQREINKKCKTHVQDLFNKGIFDAYKEAGVKFPFERLKLYGTVLKNIKKRAKDFEDKIAVHLSGYGIVNRLVKTKRGVADIIFERKGKKVVIEIKDYQNKDISISQIKQLNKYLEDCECELGVLICKKKPKKDRFLIGKNKIIVLEESQLKEFPKVIDGSVV